MLGAYAEDATRPTWAHKGQQRSTRRLGRCAGRVLRLVLVTGAILLALSAFISWPSWSLSNVNGRDVDISQSASSDSVATTSCTIGDSSRPCSKIGKVSMLYGDPGELYERAIAAHDAHNERFGYPFFVLREKTLAGYWSKPAYILQLILTELAKPADERLEWLVWFDADTVLLNPKIPLEIFLPPANDWGHIHAVMTNDHRGLNNGVFFLRIHEWSVWLMNACLGTEIFVPDMKLEFGDQTALMYWINQQRFRNNVIHVPQRWFNAYAGYRGEPADHVADPTKPQYKFRPNSVREGDLLVHHAGHKTLRQARMEPWVALAERHTPEWEVELEHTTYGREIESFWLKDAPRERRTQDAYNNRLEDAKRKKAAQKEQENKKKPQAVAAAAADGDNDGVKSVDEVEDS